MKLKFSVAEIASWPKWFYLCFIGGIFTGLEILSYIIPLAFGSWPKIPVRGKHLDKFETIDKVYILINKLLTVAFVYHVIYVTTHINTIAWKWEEATVYNTLGSLVLFYLFYDFWYMSFHRFLHIRALYPYIHKHHHRQKAPSRGNLDAINVHPFEFLVGEYLHLLTIWLIPCHISAVVVFILLGGILASLNHTRFDVKFLNIYVVNVHDVHHRLPETNYAQYIMLWDWLFGSYRKYNDTDKTQDHLL